jgi:threonyl-tRNA synthetase
MKNNETNLELLRHSTAHILAAAVFEMFPEAKFGIGPAIENGFYYDFELPRTLIPEDLPLLEEKMKAIIKENREFEKAEIKIDEAMEKFKQLNQTLKLELIDDLHKAGNETVTIYKSGNFVDLCAGPHIESAGKIDQRAFALTKISGAYWKGDAEKQQLQRIYGVVFENKEGLKNYFHMVEEAAKRDHRKLGKELDLFCFSDLVGPGLPLFTPNGTIIKDELQKHIEKVCRGYGFQKVSTPSLAKEELFETSGHAQKFGDELFHVTSEKKHDLVLKPVQCPHQTQIYASKTRSYKDLPIRYMESDKQYRAEKTGEVGGLSRVYAITVEDGHSFCRVDQVKDEIKNMVNIIRDFYSALGLWDNHWVSLSVRDYTHPEKYIGETSDWDLCENMLQEISDELGLNAKKCEGEAALYGPKLDFMFKDAIGKEIQIPTVQVDFATPKRFNLEYTNEKSEKITPVMVHRAILGSYERFLVLLIEHFAGAFPLWLSPVQVAILPISEKFADYAKEVKEKLLAQDIRIEMYDQAESLGKRISLAEKMKAPYIIVVGEKEVAEKTVAIRTRGIREQQTLPLNEFIEKIISEIKNKA